VVRNPALLTEMEQLTGGDREVPVICEDGQVTIGWKGRS
jgi:hypothetical protein